MDLASKRETRGRVTAAIPLVLLLSLAIAASGCGGGSSAATAPPAVTKTLTSISISPPGPTIALGQSQQFTATGTFSDNSKQDVTRTVTWSSTEPSVASISQSGLALGKLVGGTKLTATSGSVTASDTLTVGSAILVSIAVSPQSFSIPKGMDQSLSAIGTFSDGTQKNVTDSATWSVVPSEIATVNTAGLVTGEAVGSATITASVASVRGTDSLTVSPAVLVSIAVAPANSSIMLGTTEQFTATGTFSDGSTQDLTNSTAWSSANSKVAINPAGVVTALTVGSTTISATSDDLTGSTALTVDPQLLVTYFSQANNTASSLDATVRVTNVGMTNTSLCAMVYVFDTQQEMTECCACSASPDDLRTLSINHDLTNQPATGTEPSAGVIDIVSATAGNQACNASTSSPGGELSAWSTHIQVVDTSTFALTEAPFEVVPLTSTHASLLQSECGFLMAESRGICTCGAGD